MNEFFQSISDFFTGFTSTFLYHMLRSVISSFVFIFILLFTMRPKIKISPFICQSEGPKDKQPFYVFKIVNKSYFYALDLEINLIKKEPNMVNNGKKINYKLTAIPTTASKKLHLSGFRKKAFYGDHAYLVRTDYDLIKDINDKDITIQLSVSAKHGLTNLTKIISLDFTSADVVYIGKEFKFGSCLDINK